MSVIFSLASSALALFLLAITLPSSVFASTDWYNVGSNPIINIWNNQPFASSNQNFSLSGFFNYQEPKNRAGLVAFFHQDPAPQDTLMAFDNGPGYYAFASNLPYPVNYPYVARLSTNATGDRIYAFYQNQGNPKNLYAVYTETANYYGGPIYQCSST